MSTLQSLLTSYTLCQPILIASTSDKKYRFGVPFKVLTTQVGHYRVHIYLNLFFRQICRFMVGSRGRRLSEGQFDGSLQARNSKNNSTEHSSHCLQYILYESTDIDAITISIFLIKELVDLRITTLSSKHFHLPNFPANMEVPVNPSQTH